MDSAKRFYAILIPSVTVFFSSACIMILELVAGRLIARHLGASLYTWTSVIGVVLAGITIGNYLGGRIADRYPARRTLSGLFGAASVACVATVVLNNQVGNWFFLWEMSWPVRVFLHVSFVFLLPSAVLGTISPVVAKMALDTGLPTGRTVGDIYAWGAAGSIVGTFFAGFYLIAVMGTTAIIWSVAAALLVLAILYCARMWVLYLWAAVLVLLMTLGMAPATWAQITGSILAVREPYDPNLVYGDETQYCYVHVVQLSKEPDRRVFLQDKLKHSEIIMGDINNLQYPYQLIYAAVTHHLGDGRQTISTLTIGGGGYVFPRYIKHCWPESRVDVAEIDPGVTQAAEEAFGLERDTPINTFAMDGRNYVDELITRKQAGLAVPQYDFVYEDAVNDFTVPHQLVTKEFNDKVAQIIANDGVYMLNLIDIYSEGFFLGSIIHTIRQTFSNVCVVSDIHDYSRRSTFVVIGSNRPLDVESIFGPLKSSHSLWILTADEIDKVVSKSGRVILTDDYSPVENYLAPVVRQNAAFTLAREYIQQGKKMEQQTKWDEAINFYEKTIRLYPPAALFATYKKGQILLRQGKFEEAISISNAVLANNEKQGTGYSTAPLHLNLGIALKALKHNSPAQMHFKLAIEGYRKDLEREPDSVVSVGGLATALAWTGNYDEAEERYRRAIELDKTNVEYSFMLAEILTNQKRNDEAKQVIKDTVEFLTKTGNQAAVEELLKEYETAKFRQQQ